MTKIIDFSIDPAAVQARVAKNNAKFRKLTKAQKRVAIAKDVLLQLKARKIRALSGTYFNTELDVVPGGINGVLKPATVLTKPCEVCALGALFCGALDNTGDRVVEDNGYIPEYDIRNMLAPYFSKRDLGNIESAFEGADYEYSSRTAYLHFKKQWRASRGWVNAEFFASRKDAESRLRAIMNNIIRNKGTFKPRKVKELHDEVV